MAGVNKVILVGHLGGDPEMKYGSSGAPFTTFTMATTDTWVKDGQREERTEWHRIIAFGKLAEICAKWLHKGKQIYLEGRIQTRSWEQEGIKRYTTEIVAREMQMLGGRGDSGYQPQAGAGSGAGAGGMGAGAATTAPAAPAPAGPAENAPAYGSASVPDNSPDDIPF